MRRTIAILRHTITAFALLIWLATLALWATSRSTLKILYDRQGATPSEAYQLLLEILGPAGSFKRGSEAAALQGSLERAYQGTLILTFGGGTNEVQRDLIAVFGLKMPRSL